MRATARVPAPGPAVISAATDSGGGDGLSHLAFPYLDTAEYLDQVVPFIAGGLAREEPVLVAAPEADLARIQAALGADAWEAPPRPPWRNLRRNPARITLVLTAFAEQHPGEPVRAVIEPMWPGRTGPEVAEVMRHEALINLALAAARAELLCPYRTSLLSPVLLDGLRRTHPVILAGDGRQPSQAYQRPPDDARDTDLPAPPPHAHAHAYTSDLKAVRAMVARYAEGAGLAPERRTDLVLAVGEIIANTLSHTSWRRHRAHLDRWRADPVPGARRRLDQRPAGRAQAAPAARPRSRALGGQRDLRPGGAAQRTWWHHHPAADAAAGDDMTGIRTGSAPRQKLPGS